MKDLQSDSQSGEAVLYGRPLRLKQTRFTQLTDLLAAAFPVTLFWHLQQRAWAK